MKCFLSGPVFQYQNQSLRHVPPSEQGGSSQRSVLPQHVNPFEDGALMFTTGAEKIFLRFRFLPLASPPSSNTKKAKKDL
jgi:hypothetical protein